MTKTTYS